MSSGSRRGSPAPPPTPSQRLAAVDQAQQREERIRERTTAAEREAAERVREAEQRLVEVLARIDGPSRGPADRSLPQNAEIAPGRPAETAVGIHPPCHDGPVSTTPAQQAAHLHVHSEYSLLDGANKIDAMAARAAELGMPALGLTDHGVMNGSVELFQACGKHGIKPIMGLEAYLVDDIEEIKQKTKWERNHLTLLAANETGFKNLVKLSSAGFLEGFARGKANVDPRLLERYSEGVIALTGCLASRFCRRLVEDRPDDARAHVDDLLQIFGPEDVYFELQVNGIPEQDKANEGIARIARELGKPLVGTADVHYLRREDYRNHAALLCVQTKSTLEAPKMSFDTNEFYLKTAEEMNEAFAPWPEAIPNTLEIAERCNVEIQLGELLLPRFPTPDGSEPVEMLRRVAAEGLRRRYGDPPPAAAVERLEFELGVIEEMGFPSYFLIVWDFVRYAKENGVAVGPGRGSAAGLDRRLQPRHHRSRPARERPAVRALPEPGAPVDARHRHRLLGSRPRARDPLRRPRSTAASRSPRSSPSARWRRGQRPATPPGCSASTTAPATGSRS